MAAFRKFPTDSTGALPPAPSRKLLLPIALLASALVGLAGCNRMATPPAKQMLKDADAKAAEGEFLQAINLYENALDGTARSADVHYRLALIYDDKMHDPLSALHHFKRYLTLAPGGAHVSEVKNYMKRDELALVTTLSGDSVVSRAEGARLRNENLDLRQQLEERRAAEARTAALAKDKRGGTRPTRPLLDKVRMARGHTSCSRATPWRRSRESSTKRLRGGKRFAMPRAKGFPIRGT